MGSTFFQLIVSAVIMSSKTWRRLDKIRDRLVEMQVPGPKGVVVASVLQWLAVKIGLVVLVVGTQYSVSAILPAVHNAELPPGQGGSYVLTESSGDRFPEVVAVTLALCLSMLAVNEVA